MKNFIIPFLFIVISCSQSDNTEALEPEVIAEAAIYSMEQLNETTFFVKDSKVGIATFSQTGNIVALEIALSGMTPNTSKAVHIHNGTVEVPGRHWNRGSYFAACNERSMGSLWAKPFVGDVGNVDIDQFGKGKLTLQTDLWSLNSGDEKDLLNKVIIVHEGPEDFIQECDINHSHNHLHSNPKIGGGTIVLVSEIPQTTQSFVKTEQSMPDFLICR